MYTSAFLTGANVTNITVQNQCAADQSDHLGICYDPVALAGVPNALDPAHPVRVPCPGSPADRSGRPCPAVPK